jgi:hypothetical protein
MCGDGGPSYFRKKTMRFWLLTSWSERGDRPMGDGGVLEKSRV